MTISIAYISSFGSQTLSDSNHESCKTLSLSDKAKLELVELPNGTIFDPNGSGDANTIPEPVTALIKLMYGTQSAAESEFETIVGLVGSRDTLTATKLTSGTVTCTARLERVRRQQDFETADMTELLIELNFVPITSWS